MTRLYLAWRSEYNASSTEEDRSLVDDLIALRSATNDWPYPETEAAKRHDILEKELRTVLGDQRYEDYRVRAGHWATDRSERLRRNRAAQFDQGWAQRWFCRRAHDWGWNAGLHQGFDRSCASERSNHTSERISCL